MKVYSIFIPFYSLTWTQGKKGNTVCVAFVNEDQLKCHKKIFIFPSLEIGLNRNRILCNLKSQGIPLLLIKSRNMQLKYHLLSNCKLSSKRHYQDLKHNFPLVCRTMIWNESSPWHFLKTDTERGRMSF